VKKLEEAAEERERWNDFFSCARAGHHVLRSATRALKTGMSEEIPACLCHGRRVNLIKTGPHGCGAAELFGGP